MYFVPIAIDLNGEKVRLFDIKIFPGIYIFFFDYSALLPTQQCTFKGIAQLKINYWGWKIKFYYFNTFLIVAKKS